MPIPKMNAPKITEIPAGETRPVTGCPNRDPEANTGKNRAVAIASISICARKPSPRRSEMKTRQADVKPKAA
jgi:hypothetical protein